ncbi:hypothetical protein B296_00020749 [Ensete ventricosum]|uniref:Uncharacterized protein n=1 Tax=Ensete ventricosum TaxID=4639 RepID=A0A426YKV2_ENSVE|nr:hypothetical protein B296_00020749 [Ensete ventricosum]
MDPPALPPDNVKGKAVGEWDADSAYPKLHPACGTALAPCATATCSVLLSVSPQSSFARRDSTVFAYVTEVSAQLSHEFGLLTSNGWLQLLNASALRIISSLDEDVLIGQISSSSV